MPLVGFLPVTDERVRSTVEAIERRLMQDGPPLAQLHENRRDAGTSVSKAAFCSMIGFILRRNCNRIERAESKEAAHAAAHSFVRWLEEHLRDGRIIRDLDDAAQDFIPLIDSGSDLLFPSIADETEKWATWSNSRAPSRTDTAVPIQIFRNAR